MWEQAEGLGLLQVESKSNVTGILRSILHRTTPKQNRTRRRIDANCGSAMWTFCLFVFKENSSFTILVRTSPHIHPQKCFVCNDWLLKLLLYFEIFWYTKYNIQRPELLIDILCWLIICSCYFQVQLHNSFSVFSFFSRLFKIYLWIVSSCSVVHCWQTDVLECTETDLLEILCLSLTSRL